MSVAKRELHDAEGNSRGWYSEANRVNDLTGREWVFWSRSVITKPYPPNLQHALRNRHGGQKPPELCADLVRAFSKEGQRVLDPFMGVGGVLLGASLAGRAATGIEINPEWIRHLPRGLPARGHRRAGGHRRRLARRCSRRSPGASSTSS